MLVKTWFTTYNGITSFMDDTRYLATELGVIGKSFMGYDPEKWEQGYETDKDKPNIDTSAAPIDFIFVKKNGNGVVVEETSVPRNLNTVDLATASDHLPVVLKVKINR